MKNTELENYVQRLKYNDPTITSIFVNRKEEKYEDLDVAIKEIADALKENTQVTLFVAQRVNLHDTRLKVLLSALEINRSIHILWITGNSLTNKGAIAIANMLQKNQSIKEINLHENYISDEGAQALAAALSAHTSLTRFLFTDSHIGYNGARALDQAIENNKLICIADYAHKSRDVESILQQRLNYITKLINNYKAGTYDIPGLIVYSRQIEYLVTHYDRFKKMIAPQEMIVFRDYISGEISSQLGQKCGYDCALKLIMPNIAPFITQYMDSKTLGNLFIALCISNSATAKKIATHNPPLLTTLKQPNKTDAEKDKQETKALIISIFGGATSSYATYKIATTALSEHISESTAIYASIAIGAAAAYGMHKILTKNQETHQIS